MRAWAIAGWFILLVGPAIAQARPNPDSTFVRLANVTWFAVGGVGITGAISQGQTDFEEILSRPTAMSDFEKLFSVGNEEAKGYALVGIWKLDHNRFKELSQSLHDSRREIVTMRGCIVSRELFETVLKRIEAGQYSRCEMCEVPRSLV